MDTSHGAQHVSPPAHLPGIGTTRKRHLPPPWAQPSLERGAGPLRKGLPSQTTEAFVSSREASSRAVPRAGASHGESEQHQPGPGAPSPGFPSA